MIESLEDLRARHGNRTLELREASRQRLQGLLARSLELERRVTRLDRLDPPEAECPDDRLVVSPLVQYRRDATEPFRPVIEQPARAPLLLELLVGLAEKEDVGLRNDPRLREAAHRDRL